MESRTKAYRNPQSVFGRIFNTPAHSRTDSPICIPTISGPLCFSSSRVFRDLRKSAIEGSLPGLRILYAWRRLRPVENVGCCSETCRWKAARKLSDQCLRIRKRGQSDRDCAGGRSRHETVAKTGRGRLDNAEHLGMRRGSVAVQRNRAIQSQPTSGRTVGVVWFPIWSRPSAASANSAPGTEAEPEPETTRPTTPETDIWTGQRSSGLSRLLPLLGNRDRSEESRSRRLLPEALVALPASRSSFGKQ